MADVVIKNTRIMQPAAIPGPGGVDIVIDKTPSPRSAGCGQGVAKKVIDGTGKTVMLATSARTTGFSGRSRE